MGDGLIVQLNSLFFPELIRGFFGPIVKFLYYLIEQCIDLMYELAGNRFGLDKELDTIIGNFYAIFIIFMVFKLTISMLTYLINPESFTDKNSGFSKLITRIIISVILLVSINPFFNFLFQLQTDIIGNNDPNNPTGNVIDNLILSNQEIYTVDINGDARDIYVTRMSDYCPEGYKVYSFTKGGMFAISALKPFYQPTNPSEIDDTATWEEFIDNGRFGYCGFDFDDLETSYNNVLTESVTFWDNLMNATGKSLKLASGGPVAIYKAYKEGQSQGVHQFEWDDLNGFPHAGSEFIDHNIYNAKSGDWDPAYDEDFIIDFRYFWALVFGIAMLFMLITFCFDIVVRALTLFFYQLIAPIPIISYMSPNKKDTELLSNWAKKTFGCWASLFIRIAILDFIVYFSQIALNLFDNSDAGLVEQIFVLVGTLMFAKKLPKLLEEIIPGLRMDEPLELNPFKKISRDALGGKALLGAGAGIAAAGLSGGANAITGMEKSARNAKFGWNKGAGIRENIKNNLKASRRFAGGTFKAGGSALAGAFSAGQRAFSKTSKDGNFFGGIRQGHLEAQFAKQQREDLARKGSTFGGRVSADVNRWIGRENKAQSMNREFLERENAIKARKEDISRRKSVFQNQKDQQVRGYSRLASKFDTLNKRMESSGKVMRDGKEVKIKDAIDYLDTIKSSDYSGEVASRHAALDRQYQSRIGKATSDVEKNQLLAQLNSEKAAITVDSIKQEKLDAQNSLINQLRADYVNAVIQTKGTDHEHDAVGSQIVDEINEAKEIAKQDMRQRKEYVRQQIANGTISQEQGNQAIETIDRKLSELDSSYNLLNTKTDEDGNDYLEYNKGAMYKAQDEVTTMSSSYDRAIQALDEELYQVNLDEQQLEKDKTSDEYIRAMADNASQRVKAPQPENWLSSADIQSSTGYGGYQLHARSGGGPTPGGNPGGPGPRHGHGGGRH